MRPSGSHVLEGWYLNLRWVICGGPREETREPWLFERAGVRCREPNQHAVALLTVEKRTWSGKLCPLRAISLYLHTTANGVPVLKGIDGGERWVLAGRTHDDVECLPDDGFTHTLIRERLPARPITRRRA